MAQLIQFTLRRGPTVQTKMSLATAGIHCTISQRLSGATEDCSIVQGRQLRTLCRQRCCVSAHDACSARCGTQSPLTSIGVHANLRVAWQGHGLGLISIGVFIGKKIYFLEYHKTTADWMTSSLCAMTSSLSASCINKHKVPKSK